MAKVTGPLLSFGAQGAIGGAAVFAKWRGIDYARQYVKPANPQTTAQQANRTRFAFLREMWKLAPSILIAPWNAFAQGKPFTGMNKFVGENNRVLNGETDLQNLIGSPGAKGGLPPTAFAAATGSGSGEVDVTFTVPTQIPDGWSITSCQAIAMNDQDPTGIFDGVLVADEDDTAPYEITLTGLTAGGDVVCAGWIKWEKADGTTAYSVSIVDTATAGA